VPDMWGLVQLRKRPKKARYQDTLTEEAIKMPRTGQESCDVPYDGIEAVACSKILKGGAYKKGICWEGRITTTSEQTQQREAEKKNERRGENPGFSRSGEPNRKRRL